MNLADMAADYKFRKMDKFRAWDQYIIDSGLKPQIDAKEFYRIFEEVLPKSTREYKTPPDYKATHFDTLKKMSCQIRVDECGVIFITWQDGHTGSNPPCHPETERFELLAEPK